MRKTARYGLLLLMLFFSRQGYSQGENNTWYFGDSAGVDFSADPPTALFNPFYSHEAVATISDKNGNLLFYTNNKEVYDRNHNLMPNGSGLLGEYSNTQTLAIRQPGSKDLYYIFTTDNAELSFFVGPLNSHGFRYSIVDLSQNSGLGDVVLKNQLLLDSSTEKVAAVPHQNGVDYWIVMHHYGTDEFRSYLLSCSGLDTNFVSSKVGSIHNDTFWWKDNMTGPMKASLNGDMIGLTIPYDGKVEVFKFNKQTGALHSPIYIQGIVDSLPHLNFRPMLRKFAFYWECFNRNFQGHLR